MNVLKFMTCERRLIVMHGVASALTYLEEECQNQIIHRDVNIFNPAQPGSRIRNKRRRWLHKAWTRNICRGKKKLFEMKLT
ncbi:hypothetical protein ABFS82_13G041400 [Erythranthe guttata]